MMSRTRSCLLLICSSSFSFCSCTTAPIAVAHSAVPISISHTLKKLAEAVNYLLPGFG